MELSIPSHLYLRRKTFELGGAAVHSDAIRAGTQATLVGLPPASDPMVSRLDEYWARELELLRVHPLACNGYGSFLPGRLYTYRRLAELLHTVGGPGPYSVADIGSGSGVLGLCLLGATRYVAIDVSPASHALARHVWATEQVQADSFGVRGTYAALPLASWSIDVAVSLGLLEHLDLGEQRTLLQEALRVAPTVVLVVPNTRSPIFVAMCDLEASEMGATYSYPQEDSYVTVDFSELAAEARVRLRATGALHLPPPRRLRIPSIDEQAGEFFSRIIGLASSRYRGSAELAWQDVEASCDPIELAEFGWFSYGIFEESGQR